MPDATVEPRDSVLINSTMPRYETGRANGVAEKMGLIVVPSTGTYANGWAANTTLGYGKGSTEVAKARIGIREISAYNPNTAIMNDKAAVTVAGDNIDVHILVAGDEHWAYIDSALTLGDKAYTSSTAGQLAKMTDGGTDSQCHVWECLKTISGAGWTKVRYLGIQWAIIES